MWEGRSREGSPYPDWQQLLNYLRVVFRAKGGGMKRLMTVLAAVAVLVGLVGGSRYVSSQDEPPRQPERMIVNGDLVVRNNQWSGEPKIIGYGSGAHAWTTKTATCPEGTFVAGIRVQYRGTCLEQCNYDGGIIGNIELVCQPL